VKAEHPLKIKRGRSVSNKKRQKEGGVEYQYVAEEKRDGLGSISQHSGYHTTKASTGNVYP
jgi:hypothetical protein